MRLPALLAFLAMLAATSACTSSPTHPAHPVEITGHLLAVGGPPPGSPRPLRGTVTLVGNTHSTVATRADGSYTAPVLPGVYTVTGHSPEYGSNRYLCQASAHVRVTTAKSVNVYCQER